MPQQNTRPDQEKKPPTSNHLDNNYAVFEPDSKNSSIDLPKKSPKLRTLLIVVAIVIIIIAVALAATGLYAVPGLASLFGTDRPKDLGVSTSDEALASLKQKVPMTISGASVDYGTVSLVQTATGSIPVDAEITSSEITSWLSRHQGDGGPVTDVQVKYIEGGMELSGMLHEYVEAPVYAKVMVDQTGANSVALTA